MAGTGLPGAIKMGGDCILLFFVCATYDIQSVVYLLFFVPIICVMYDILSVVYFLFFVPIISVLCTCVFNHHFITVHSLSLFFVMYLCI